MARAHLNVMCVNHESAFFVQYFGFTMSVRVKKKSQDPYDVIFFNVYNEADRCVGHDPGHDSHPVSGINSTPSATPRANGHLPQQHTQTSEKNRLGACF